MSETRSYRFDRPIPYSPWDCLALLTLGSRDPSFQRIDERGFQTLRWVEGELCRIVLGFGQSTLAVQVDGPTASLVGEEHARALLGLHDQGGLRLEGHDPVYRLARDNRGLRLVRAFWLYEAAMNAILSQRVSGPEVASNWQRLCRRFGESRHGLHSAPSPERLRGMSMAELAACGIEAKRAVPLKEMAFRLRSLPSPELTGEQVERLLLGCRGVGAWTRAIVRAQFWGDPDVVPPGDYGIPSMVSWALAGERHGTDQRMLELLEPYRGQRFRVIRYLWSGKDTRERRGPRLPMGQGIG